jgi:hypothetical protein
VLINNNVFIIPARQSDMQDLQAHGTISKDSNTGLGLDDREAVEHAPTLVVWQTMNTTTEHIVSGTYFFINQFIFSDKELIQVYWVI